MFFFLIFGQKLNNKMHWCSKIVWHLQGLQACESIKATRLYGFNFVISQITERKIK